jgi:ABC-type multidrug transport system fused ATPase/permease subunit
MTVVLGGGFLTAAVLLGLLDFLERLWFARFAIASVRDLREAAFESARARRAAGAKTGDLVARLIGDTARIKAGLKGFLVHVATNAVLLCGVACVLLVIYPPMGMIFGAICVGLLIVTTVGATRMYARAARYRRKEGRLAERIRGAVADENVLANFDDVNLASSHAEASLTHAQGLATWSAHTLFALAALGAVGTAIHGLSTGSMDVGSVVAIALYTMMLRAPMVQIVRQGTRTGKIAACVERVAALLDEEGSAPRDPATLREGIVVDGVRRRARRARGGGRILQIERLEIPAGQHLAIVGRASSGRSSLLRLLAGRWRPKRGQVRWDGAPVTGEDALAEPHASLATPDLSWPRRRLRDVLDLGDDPERAEAAGRVLEACGAGSLARGLDRGLGTKLRSSELSATERRAVAVARAVASEAPLVLLDDVVDDRSRRAAERTLRVIIDACPGRTVVVSLRREPAEGLFDRVITVRKGKIVDDSCAPALAAPDGSVVREVRG